MKTQNDFPLGEWIREASIYNMMKNLRVFKLHAKRKPFSVWKSNCRQIKFVRIKAYLESRALVAKPNFLCAIMDINKYVCQLSEINLIVTNETKEEAKDHTHQSPIK